MIRWSEYKKGIKTMTDTKKKDPMKVVKIGANSKPRKDVRNRWVQTEQSSHEAWGELCKTRPKAAALLHFFCARLDRQTNAVVTTHKVLAKIMGVTDRSIRTYIKQLEKDRWIQVVSLGKGATNAYVVNSLVAWAQTRDNFKYAKFSAQVIADFQDQDKIDWCDLKKIPVLFNNEEIAPVEDRREEQQELPFIQDSETVDS